jgi:hypothetical protein
VIVAFIVIRFLRGLAMTHFIGRTLLFNSVGAFIREPAMRASGGLVVRTSLYRNWLTVLLSLASSLFAAGTMAQLSTQTVTQTTQTVTQAAPDWLGKLSFTVPAAAALLVQDPDDYTGGFQVIPGQFDPGKTYLVQSAWLNAIGCPTSATTALPNASFTGVGGYSSFTDAACPDGDPNDSRVEGLLLAKTGPTYNFASAFARIVGIKGKAITTLGWDIRKYSPTGVFPIASDSPLGSHCGAGAPRWNIATTDGFFFLGCNSPPAPVQVASDTGWIRMRWPAPLLAYKSGGIGTPEPVTGTVTSLTIVFDEGQDASGAPDQFGAAILDNIYINGVMVGRGPVNAK